MKEGTIERTRGRDLREEGVPLADVKAPTNQLGGCLQHFRLRSVGMTCEYDVRPKLQKSRFVLRLSQVGDPGVTREALDGGDGWRRGP